MAAAAELYARSELHHAYTVAVLLSEECDCSHFLGLGHSGAALLVELVVLTYELIDPLLYGSDLLVAELFVVREVEAEVLVADERSLLLHVCADNFSERLVEKVGAAVVGGNPVSALSIYAKGELA